MTDLLHRFLSRTILPIWIGGAAEDTTTMGNMEVRNPATGQHVARIAVAGPIEAERAARAARQALEQGAWPDTTPRQRSRLLEQLAARLADESDSFARLEVLQTGKTITEARGDVARAVDGLRYYAAAALMNRGETIEVDNHRRAQTVRVPVGVIAAIVPWNVPLVLTVSKIAPALAVGNTVVIKPSEFTPLTALMLAEIAAEAGFPPGVINVVTGLGGDVGRALTESPLVDGITFTGSTATGEKVGMAAAQYHKRLQAELGGKSAHLIFADADLEKAIPAAAWGVFYGQGQICSAGSRLLVERSIHDEVVAGVAAIADSIRLGDPFDPDSQMGSLISQAHRAKVCAMIARAIEDGCSTAAGGGAAVLAGFEDGAFMQPTVLTGVSPDMEIAQEEVFGPVLSVIPFDTEDEAVAIANGTRYGLAAGIWSGNRPRAMRVARRLKTGVVWLESYNHFDPLVPFGGVKHSGGGSREWSHLALESFVDIKTIWEVL